ncbi:pre-toxin TG domain-containing protein [Scopulibacillus cellulosilyticus]|uniref:Pre-toxin TG domain-containing protein n=1 Tax=Scopulibacillus cellulosilyticus TaxID=2665665 RepID=A0ABW2PY53_9BACL
MGKIKVDPDRLEELANRAGNAEELCGAALLELKWHFTSLIAEASDLEGSYASSLYQQLINHIDHYKELLCQSQDFLMRTVAEFRQADETTLDHIWNIAAEILPIHDMERTQVDYDPVTGEKIGLGDSLLASTMVVLPGIKGIKFLAKSKKVAKLVNGIRNVLHPNLIKKTFYNTYQRIKHQSLSLINKGVKKIGNIRLPQVLQPSYAGIGKIDTTVKDLFAKEAIIKAASKEGGGRAAAGSASHGVDRPRPSWRQSEIDVGKENPEYNAQKSFKDGKEVPYGEKGSSRPDFYRTGHSIEVKNYKITTSSDRSRLANNVSKQVEKRLTDLPNDTKQSVIIDIRGQNVSDEILDKLYEKIMEKTKGRVNIRFKTNE